MCLYFPPFPDVDVLCVFEILLCGRKEKKTLCVLHYNDVIMSAIASQITSLTNVYSTVSDALQRKHQSSALLAFVRGNHRGPVTNGQLRGKCFHLMTSSLTQLVADDLLSWHLQLVTNQVLPEYIGHRTRWVTGTWNDIIQMFNIVSKAVKDNGYGTSHTTSLISYQKSCIHDFSMCWTWNSSKSHFERS